MLVLIQTLTSTSISSTNFKKLLMNINSKKTSLNLHYQHTLDTLYETHLDVFNISIQCKFQKKYIDSFKHSL